jgi:hypothetical protein
LMIAGFLRYSDVANILVHDDFIVLWRQNSLMLIGSILSNYKTDSYGRVRSFAWMALGTHIVPLCFCPYSWSSRVTSAARDQTWTEAPSWGHIHGKRQPWPRPTPVVLGFGTTIAANGHPGPEQCHGHMTPAGVTGVSGCAKASVVPQATHWRHHHHRRHGGICASPHGPGPTALATRSRHICQANQPAGTPVHVQPRPLAFVQGQASPDDTPTETKLR